MIHLVFCKLTLRDLHILPHKYQSIKLRTHFVAGGTIYIF
jgi:hypothetical protein